jgi:hypothetical protein
MEKNTQRNIEEFISAFLLVALMTASIIALFVVE